MRSSPRLSAALCLAVVVALAATYASPRAAPQQSTSAEVSTESLDDLLASAEKLLDARRGFDAQPLFERALTQAISLGREQPEAQVRAGLGEVLFYRTQYAAARDHGARALEIYERLRIDRGIGRVSHLLSLIDEVLGNGASAVANAERAVAAFGRADLRGERAVATLQLLSVSQLDVKGRQLLYERAIDDARAAGNAVVEGRALHHLGDDFFNAGEYEQSLDLLTRAAAIFRKADVLDDLGTVYNSLGRVYRAHGRYDEALKSQLAALDLHQKLNVPYTLMQSQNAVATVYQLMGDLPNARKHYEQALAIAEKSGSPRVQDTLRANLATLLYVQGQYSQAAEIFEQVIAHGVDPFPGRRYSALSATYEKLARPQDSLVAANKAIEICKGDENVCLTARIRRGLAESALGDRQAALTDINAALTMVEDVRRRLVPLDFFKQEFNRTQEDVYGLAIGLQLADKQDRLALETAELARSRAFLDLLASRDVRFKEKDQRALASLRETGTTASEPITLASNETKSALPITLRGEAEASIARLASVPAGSLELRSMVSATPSAADDLVATAARLKSTLLVYWVQEDEIFIWVVGRDGTVQSRRVKMLKARLLELIRATAPFVESEAAKPAGRVIATRGSSQLSLQSAPAAAWRALYDIVIAPVRSALPRSTGALLTIVPHGPLQNVSFAALQSSSGRYLLEDYTLHYAPAGAVLQFTAPKKRADARTGPMLVVADPALPRLSTLDRPLPRLPGARGEAASIARLVPAGRLTVLQDAVATEARARDAVAGKAVLHFATHAVVRDDDPFASFLALGPSSGGKSSDGLLTSQEVYGLDLNADLVVLSACRSAGGSVNGDGISAFARAFIYAGTASLVASLWDVADEPTNRLLPDFYRTWLGGASKARALRSAQLKLLNDLRAGRVTIDTPAGAVSIPEHPVFWAGFALFGEPD
jgi:CHAT domain-containing protein/tetratricopeptide (TPR) repeat protein